MFAKVVVAAAAWKPRFSGLGKKMMVSPFFCSPSPKKDRTKGWKLGKPEFAEAMVFDLPYGKLIIPRQNPPKLRESIKADGHVES